MMDTILENRTIDMIAAHFKTAPHKIGRIHEADAEIVDLGGGSPHYLAVTTDALVEEISSGLYDDPYFMGWMLAMVNFSDLAAVGADPLGLLLSISYPTNGDSRFAAKLARGVSDACNKLGTFVLGGDTNQGGELLLSGCAVGLVPKQSVLTRKGARTHDSLYMTSRAGLGNVYAFLKLGRMRFLPARSFYKPVARIKEGRIIREFASSCMDTSDGVIHTIDTLMRLNRRWFVLYDDWAAILHPIAYRVCLAQGIPPWLVLAGIHGEFELVFTVSPQRERPFLSAAAERGWTPLKIGEVREGQGVSIQGNGGATPLDTAAIRNLSEQAGSDPQAYIKRLVQIAQESGIA